MPKIHNIPHKSSYKYSTIPFKNFIPHKYPYLIYCLWPLLRKFKIGYPASIIVINSSSSFWALHLCVTPFYLQSLTIYGIPITIFYHSVDTMNKIMNGYIDTCLLSKLVLGHDMNITRTNQHTSPS